LSAIRCWTFGLGIAEAPEREGTLNGEKNCHPLTEMDNRRRFLPLMSDIDPAKMTEAERRALFASFTKDLIPACPPRQTLIRQLTPWLPAILAERDRGLDWKQLAQICATNLKIEVSPSTLERTVRTLMQRTEGRRKKRKRGGATSTPIPPSDGPSPV